MKVKKWLVSKRYCQKHSEYEYLEMVVEQMKRRKKLLKAEVQRRKKSGWFVKYLDQSMCANIVLKRIKRTFSFEL